MTQNKVDQSRIPFAELYISIIIEMLYTPIFSARYLRGAEDRERTQYLVGF